MPSKEPISSHDQRHAKHPAALPVTQSVQASHWQAALASAVGKAESAPQLLQPSDMLQLQISVGNRGVIQRSKDSKLAAKAMATPSTRQVNCHHTVMAWLREAGILSERKFLALFANSGTADEMMDTLTTGRAGPVTKFQLLQEAAGRIVVFEHNGNVQHSMVIPRTGFIAGINNAGVHVAGGGEYQLFLIQDLNWFTGDLTHTQIEHPQSPHTYYTAHVCDVATVINNIRNI